MIFTPYKDEMKVIRKIHKFHNQEYSLLRMTSTMIDKNNLDANVFLREILYNAGVVDYEELLDGGINGVISKAIFIQSGKTIDVNLKFYRVASGRGDRRFSIERVRNKAQNQQINEGDLLYFSVFKDKNGNPKVFIINLTHNIPTEEEIQLILGRDETSMLLDELRPKLTEIVQGGFFDNSKGAGKKDDKDVGDTLEHLLGIETNNRDDADYKGRIEIKGKGAKTLDTLFTLRPNFEGTEIERVENLDRHRVSAFTRLYGYDSEKHLGYSSLYVTIGSKDYPQNNQGFYLEVDDENARVNLLRNNPKSKKTNVIAFWNFEDLKAQLYKKHPATLWVKAISRQNGDMVQFKYESIEFSRAPQFVTFISMIKSGVVTYDWRGYTTKEGKYSGKNHGNAWRIKPKAKSDLFCEIARIHV